MKVPGVGRENVQGKANADRTHDEAGRKVRRIIAELGGTMPEELPTAEYVKKVEKGKTNNGLEPGAE